ncbi:2-polyprenyl-6-methoxyphenol hydroxylase-like FAD-dependent oxidoreductase [Kribbella aluminosa]|uniref:2-polyprenyl-6-methoxyphenol hydroxylase-like FAD-dependent oxidoreductase n=1 Tax=Kribbella aluminosa TaxID=416017 RepID=A0ABS4UQF8_9ACTN|nr:NAD(P)/FAD-dependent oxidoreductase [Kribbella aluminosa]MBP2353878.1 2-polyprenyl-6-methoxyphenol hydroxylase-like FAD-dependent oxidoreductase [Kribbella aluminosa]
MMTPQKAAVVVVGAGPVGLAVAVGLRLHGHDVVVVDKQAEGANTSRACVIHPRTLEVLEQLGVTKRLIDLGLELQDFAVRSGDRRLIPVGFADLPTAYPFVTMIPQPVTEQVLLERLQELGGSVLRPYAATGLSQTADGVDVTLDSGDVIHAQYVVAADGMHSTVRELAGLRMPGNTLELSLSLVDVRVADGLPTDEVGLYFAAAGMLVVAPLPDGSFRLVAEVHDAPEHPDLAYAQQLLASRGPRKTHPKVTEVVWGSRFRIHERVADHYRAGRVLLAGDAAHTHSPAGGQGMNLGLRDAVALAGALSQALAGDESGLDTYATNSRAEAVRVIGLAHRLTRLANVPRPIRPVRNAVLRLVGRGSKTQTDLAKQLAGLPER